MEFPFHITNISEWEETAASYEINRYAMLTPLESPTLYGDLDAAWSRSAQQTMAEHQQQMALLSLSPPTPGVDGDYQHSAFLAAATSLASIEQQDLGQFQGAMPYDPSSFTSPSVLSTSPALYGLPPSFTPIFPPSSQHLGSPNDPLLASPLLIPGAHFISPYPTYPSASLSAPLSAPSSPSSLSSFNLPSPRLSPIMAQPLTPDTAFGFDDSTSTTSATSAATAIDGESKDRYQFVDVDPLVPPAPTPRVFVACQNCHLKKRRCPKGIPCERCLRAGIKCVAQMPQKPAHGVKKTKGKAEVDRALKKKRRNDE